MKGFNASDNQAIKMANWVEMHTRARMAQLRAAQALFVHYCSSETGVGTGASKLSETSKLIKLIKRSFADLITRRFRDLDVDVRTAAAGAAATVMLSTDSANHGKVLSLFSKK